jgi:hypothetical protein
VGQGERHGGRPHEWEAFIGVAREDHERHGGVTGPKRRGFCGGYFDIQPIARIIYVVRDDEDSDDDGDDFYPGWGIFSPN